MPDQIARDLVSIHFIDFHYKHLFPFCCSLALIVPIAVPLNYPGHFEKRNLTKILRISFIVRRTKRPTSSSTILLPPVRRSFLRISKNEPRNDKLSTRDVNKKKVKGMHAYAIATKAL